MLCYTFEKSCFVIYILSFVCMEGLFFLEEALKGSAFSLVPARKRYAGSSVGAELCWRGGPALHAGLQADCLVKQQLLKYIQDSMPPRAAPTEP